MSLGRGADSAPASLDDGSFGLDASAAPDGAGTGRPAMLPDVTRLLGPRHSRNAIPIAARITRGIPTVSQRRAPALLALSAGGRVDDPGSPDEGSNAGPAGSLFAASNWLLICSLPPRPEPAFRQPVLFPPVIRK